MANEKSKAEQYRDERKARIAKAAKKNAHSMEKRNTAKKIVNKVIAIVLCVAIVLAAAGYLLNYYGAIQRVIRLGSVGEEESVSLAEYEYYYMRAYNQIRYQSQYYQYYYQTSNGYDTSLSPEDQPQTTKDDDGNEISWVEKLHNDTIQLIQLHKTYYNKAVEAGLKLSKADEAYIDKQIESLREEAKSASKSSEKEQSNMTYSLNAYLRKVYGGAVNERFLRRMLKIQTLAQKYVTQRTAEIAKGYDQKTIDEAYKKDTSSYDIVTFRVYTFQTQTLTAEENETDDALKARQAKADAEVKKNANDFLNAVKDENSFIAKAKAANKDDESYDADKSTKLTNVKSYVSQNFSEDIANWLFNSTTKDGSKKLFSDEDNGKYTIVLAVKGPHQEKTVSVRHILFATKDQSTNEALSAEEIANKKAKAESTLKKFNEGDKSEDSFAALANEFTEDTGTNTNGGLYENIYPGQMVSAFNDWIFDSKRKTGDVDIVETEFGYHLIYFVKADGTEYYDSAIRASKASEDFEKESQELLDGDTYTAYIGPRLSQYAEKSALKKIKRLVEINKQNSSSSSSYSS